MLREHIAPVASAGPGCRRHAAAMATAPERLRLGLVVLELHLHEALQQSRLPLKAPLALLQLGCPLLGSLSLLGSTSPFFLQCRHLHGSQETFVKYYGIQPPSAGAKLLQADYI